ncbi:hypothetical protein [Nostoc commune]|nr:hypothetical protein [Nostoc commune]
MTLIGHCKRNTVKQSDRKVQMLRSLYFTTLRKASLLSEAIRFIRN